MTKSPGTPEEYISQLPEDRRDVMSKLRKIILDNLPAEFAKTITYGMIGYVVPHEVYPTGYHTNPDQQLPFINLASQGNQKILALFNTDCENRHIVRPLKTSKKQDIIMRVFRSGWRYAIGELVIVFVGITGAFMLENWRTGRQETRVANEYLASFTYDLQADSTTLETILQANHAKMQTVDRMITATGSGE